MKNFVIDTNVLLHNAESLQSFEDNTVVLPMSVIEELDKFKSRNDELGRNARKVIRDLDHLREKGSLRVGVRMENGGLLYSLGSRADYMAWDAAGERLYVIRSGDLFHVDSLQENTILTGRNLAYPAFSPDKRYLACVSQSMGNSLIIVDLNFGDFVTVRPVNPPQFSCGDYRMLSWSPDSREVAFIDQENGTWAIYRVDRDGYSAIEKVTDDATVKVALTW